MIKNFHVVDLREQLTTYHIAKYPNYKIKLNYHNQQILPIRIENVESIESIQEYVRKLLDEEIAFRIKNILPTIVFNKISTQLYNIMIELIQNVKRHAYDEEANLKLFGVYIRKDLA